MSKDLRELKESPRSTLNDVNLMINIDISRLSSFEQGVASPTAKDREILALLYGVKPEELFPFNELAESINDEQVIFRAG